jgi:hypothetical protein
MTRLAEEAMGGLRVLPDDMQDTIARHIIRRYARSWNAV